MALFRSIMAQFRILTHLRHLYTVTLRYDRPQETPLLSHYRMNCFSVESLQEVTSQEESFMPDISGYILERVN